MKSIIPCVIVLLMAGISVAETKVWTGTGVWSNSANWAPAGMPAAGDDAVIRTGTVLFDSPASIHSLIISNGATLTFTNWDSVLTVTSDMVIRASGTVTLPVAFNDLKTSNNVYITCQNFTIEAGGKIDATGKGYAGGISPGGVIGQKGYGPGASGGDREGAAHGGRGTIYGSMCGLVYGSLTAPVAPGSGGSGNYGSTGGAGGGAVRVHASGAMLLNGNITATAASLPGGDSGSGSGGSIYLTCSTLAGSNAILAADGQNGANGNGGGGRIAVYCDSVAQSAMPHHSISLSVRRGTGNANWAEFGTIYLSDFNLFPKSGANCNGPISGPTNWAWSDESLTLNNCWLSWPGAAQFSVTNSVILNGTTLAMTNLNMAVGGDLILTNTTAANVSWNLYCVPTNEVTTNGAWISVGGALVLASNVTWNLYSDPTNGGSAYFSVGALRLDQGAQINTTGKGYAGGAGGNGWGPGGGTNATGGGGYGGRGGDVTKGGGIYGLSHAPVLPGSGGGGNTGGRGGGLVRINATGAMTLNGGIYANGSNGVTAGAGGSGGGIFLTASSFTPASGTLTANGGSGATASYGGGGGGRIAMLARSDGFVGHLSVTNGGSGVYTGAVGSIHRGLTGGTLTLNIEGYPARHGAPSEPYYYGNNAVSEGMVITNSVGTPADTANGQRFTCIGWSLSNSLGTVSSGTDTQVIFSVDTNLYLVWHWTNEYYLAVSANTNGALSPDPTGWYTNGTAVTIQGVAESDFGFLQWSGSGVPAGQYTVTPLVVTMDRTRTIVGQFATTTPPAVRRWSGVGDWWSFANWSPVGVPGRGEAVVISSGTNTLRDPVTVASMIVSNAGTLIMVSTGELSVATSLVITGASAVVSASNVSFSVGNDVIVTGGGKLYVTGGAVSSPSNEACTVTVKGTLKVQVDGAIYPRSHPVNGGSVFFRVGFLVVDNGGRIDADSCGYGGNYGIGVGSVRGGGGHGGRGGSVGPELGGITYGNSNAPVQPGSGGGVLYGPTRAGGGVVWVNAERTVTVNGVVTANGGSASHDIGAGAGGSIYIRCLRFAGSGFYEARGGDTSGTSGGGGGGRIAVYSEFNTFTGTLSTNSVRGGVHSTAPANSGLVGTLVWVQVPRAGTIMMIQ